MLFVITLHSCNSLFKLLLVARAQHIPLAINDDKNNIKRFQDKVGKLAGLWKKLGFVQAWFKYRLRSFSM